MSHPALEVAWFGDIAVLLRSLHLFVSQSEYYLSYRCQ
jgi:hypothetical protein